jgi:hypothetical protein
LDEVDCAALAGAVANGPLVVLVAITGAEDFELTVMGKAGTIRLLFGPVGGALAAEATLFGGGGTAAAATPIGARASATEGFESLGGVGPGAGDTVEIGVILLPAVVSCALSLTGSSLGA